jgi:uncharacterized membrane protein YgcG
MNQSAWPAKAQLLSLSRDVVEETIMKLATIVLATALALSGTSSFAQTGPGSPAARQWIGDPLTQKPTYDEMRRGVTTGRNTVRLREEIGGTPESQQSGTFSGGGGGGGGKGGK